MPLTNPSTCTIYDLSARQRVSPASSSSTSANTPNPVALASVYPPRVRLGLIIRSKLLQVIRVNKRIGGNHTCNLCKMRFSSVVKLNKHIVEMHGFFECHICSAKFRQRGGLQLHAMGHVYFEPFRCLLCAAAFFKRADAAEHIRVYHSESNISRNIEVLLWPREALDFLTFRPDYADKPLELITLENDEEVASSKGDRPANHINWGR